MRNALWLATVPLALCAGSVQAQGLPGYNPGNTPVISPYLNIIRGGAPTYLNYFGLTQPQQQFSGAIQQLQTGQAYGAAQQSTFQNMILTLPATGHRTSFMSHMQYFNTTGMGGMGMGMMGGMGMGGMMGGMGMGRMMGGMGGMMMGGMGMGGGMGGMGGMGAGYRGPTSSGR